jgi:hypothetical protein
VANPDHGHVTTSGQVCCSSSVSSQDKVSVALVNVLECLVISEVATGNVEHSSIAAVVPYSIHSDLLMFVLYVVVLASGRNDCDTSV